MGKISKGESRFKVELRHWLQEDHPKLWSKISGHNQSYNTENLFKLLKISSLTFGGCKHCGSETRFHPLKLSYRKFCCKLCASTHQFKSEEFRNSAKATWLKRYGTENPMSSSCVKKTRQDTWDALYANGHPMKDDTIKAQRQKTFERRYEGGHPTRDPSCREKTRKAWASHLGGHPMRDPRTKAKIVERHQKTYGVDHPMQDANHYTRVRSSALQAKQFNSKKTGRVLVCQGYEPHVLKYLDSHVGVKAFTTEAKKMEKIFYRHEGKTRRYYIDILARLVDNSEMYIEVKSVYNISPNHDSWKCNLAKFKEVNARLAKRSKDETAQTFWLAIPYKKDKILWIKTPTRAKVLNALKKIQKLAPTAYRSLK